MRISDWSSDVCSSDLLDVVAENATRLERSPARLQQTLADASFDTWIKYYQPDENTPKTAASYYGKGALVALCLELLLRRDRNRTPHYVMRPSWARGAATGIGEIGRAGIRERV